jgi:hypothetical protein
VLAFYACTHKSYYPDTTHHDAFMTEPTDTSVCFQRDVLPVFQSGCAISGCHDAASKKKGYTLYSYAIITALGLVKGNAAGSKVYTVCISGSMPKSLIQGLTVQLQGH